jgi:hypothetical protein
MSNRTKAIIVGILILVAYSMLASGVTDIKWVTTLLDVISGLAVIGITILLFPFFKTSNKGLTIGYIAMKVLEGALMIAAGILLLSNLSTDWRSWIYNYPQTYVFIISAFLFYILLFKTKLVPRFISIWGLVACGMLLINNVAKLVGITSPILDVLMVLIITNELFLAGWLMIKGFNKSITTSK